MPAFGTPVKTPASLSTAAPFNIPVGVAPASPQDGDVWRTAAGLFTRDNGVTVGPLSTGGGSGNSPPTHPGYASGRAYPGPRSAATVSANMQAGRTYCTPIIVTATITVSAIQVPIVGNAPGQVRCGIYSSSAGLPTTLVAEGAGTSDAAGAVNIPVSATLQPGAYWMAVRSTNTSSTTCYNATEALLESLTGLVAVNGFTTNGGSASALQSPFVYVDGATASSPPILRLVIA